MRTVLLFATAIATLGFLFFLGPLIIHSSDHWLSAFPMGVGYTVWLPLHRRFPRCSWAFGTALIFLTLFLIWLLYLPFPKSLSSPLLPSFSFKIRCLPAVPGPPEKGQG
jgi:hypothetical protein